MEFSYFSLLTQPHCMQRHTNAKHGILLCTDNQLPSLQGFQECRTAKSWSSLDKGEAKGGPKHVRAEQSFTSKAQAFLKGDESTPGSPLEVRSIGGSTCQCREKEPVLPISHWNRSSKKTKNPKNCLRECEPDPRYQERSWFIPHGEERNTAS